MVRSKFEDELMFGMQRELNSHTKKQGMTNLVKAAEYLHSALDILEESGMQAQADKVLGILNKIACGDEQDARGKPHKPKNPTKVSDSHVNLKDLVEDVTDKGGAFNIAFDVPDQNDAEDLLNVDIGEEPLTVSDPDPEKTFEDSD